MITAKIYLIHDNHTPESSLPAHHVLKRLGRVLEWELLNHAVDVVDLGKLDSFLAICGHSISFWTSELRRWLMTDRVPDH